MNEVNIETIIREMSLAKGQYETAQETGIGVNAAKERMKNIAFNYFVKLLDIAKKSGELNSQVEALTIALNDSDKELSALKKAKKKNDAE